MTLIPLFRPRDGNFKLSHELLGVDGFLELVRAASLLNMGGYPIDFLNEPLVNVASREMHMPGTLESPPQYREGSMIVMANHDIRLSHSSQHTFAQYESGMIKKVLSSEDYQKTVAPDVTICPSCKYLELCRENGMNRPSESYGEMSRDMTYCRQILDAIAAGE